MEEHGWPERLLPGPTVGASAFTGLARTVVGQQLSWQVARVIFARVQAACGVSRLALLRCACFALPLVCACSSVLLEYACRDGCLEIYMQNRSSQGTRPCT